jgi:pSer/pThr/pTyr-binding forkhead associated (FHA) protein
MAGSPRVQLSLKGRLLSEVAFNGPQLRIGRMRENDVVVNNLAVSRFHATLRREGDGYVLEDLGSENGTQVNGKRISGSVPIAPGDVIQLGKYELRIDAKPGMQIAGPPARKSNDVWDSSQTFFAPPAPGAEKPAAAPTSSADLVSEKPSASAAPDPDGVFAFGDDDLAAAAEAPPAASAAPASEAPSPEHTSLFDFGAPLLSPATPPAGAQPADVEPNAPEQKLHAGLIVQRDGKLHQLRPWDGGELCAGRAPECEIVLADAGVSRRHALFSRAAGSYEVRDLDSVNGIYVNGQRTKRHALAVGDVIRIESFELTFVLDHQPVGAEVSGPTPPAAASQERGRATQFSLEAPALESAAELELAPLAGDPSEQPELASAPSAAPFEDNTDGFEILPVDADPVPDGPTAQASAEPEPALPVADLLNVDSLDEPEPEEKESTEQRKAKASRRAAAPAPAPRALRQPLVVKVAIDRTGLSPRALEALAVLAEEGVAVATLLSVERSGS